MSATGPLRRAAVSRDDWETPWDFYLALDAEFYFTLDAAATKENAKARHFITPEQDSLSVEWTGTVWINPPWGRGLDAWVEKCIAQADRGCTVVALLPNRTDCRWFWGRVLTTADEVRFVEGRIAFVGTTSSPTEGCMVIVWRPNPRLRSGSPRVSSIRRSA